MAEVYSSLFKGNVHVTQGFSTAHPAMDIGNYKAQNLVYSPNALGSGYVSHITKQYTYKGVTYDALTVWYTYDSGYQMALVHSYVKNQKVTKGQRINVGDLIYQTGNAGYSSGDHLHSQLKLNGKLIDPVPLLLDDKEGVMTYPKKGDKIEWLQDTYIKPAPETKPSDSRVKTAVKGSVFEVISDEVRKSGDYYWMDTRCNNAQGWARVKHTGGKVYYKITTKAITNYNGSAVVVPKTCEQKLADEIRIHSLTKIALSNCGKQVENVNDEKEVLLEQMKKMEKDCDEAKDQMLETIDNQRGMLKALAINNDELTAENKELKEFAIKQGQELEACREGNSGCNPLGKFFKKSDELPLEGAEEAKTE